MTNKIPIRHSAKVNKSLGIENQINEQLKKKRSESLSFSFFRLDIEHELFNCGGLIDGWFIDFLIHLKEVSKLTWVEFWTAPNSMYT
jgi:hypothetical protein